MTKDELLQRLRAFEWTDVEFKEAQRAAPRSAYETVSAFATTDEFLDPTEKEVRNPAIVAAFRRIGLSEQAGTGVRAIFRSWQRLGHVPPVIENDKARRTFELRLLREELLSEEQRLFQARLGVRLDEPQARLFAFAFREGGASLTDAKAVTGRNGPEARKVLESLVVQGLLQPIQEGTLYALADHLPGRLEGAAAGTPASAEPTGDLVTDQVVRRLTGHQVRIVKACDVPRSLAELMERVGVTHRTFFRRRHLQPLLDAGIVRMTNPANPQAANQRYVLTEAGVEIKAARIGERSKEEPDEEG